jgi:threonine/homoserine/homoserine lactone efflux protein
MTNLYSFVLAALPLLVAPGPTNALLAAVGATAGFRQSALLVAAPPLGYAVTVTALVALVVPLTQHSTLASPALHIACGLYLAHTAWKLWTEPRPREGKSAAGFGRVFTATLTNPKGLVVAFVLLPRHPDGASLAASAPFVVALMALAAGAAVAWIAAGALVRSRLTGLDGGTVCKTNSIVLAGFAAAMWIAGASQSIGWAFPPGAG